jgi:predicted methyltransferase
MRQLVTAFAIAALAASGTAFTKTDDTKPIAAALADSSRPAGDTARDAARKALETLIFTGIKPGDKVADYAAGSGYFTRLFADIAGPGVHVYAFVPNGLFQFPGDVSGAAEVQIYAGAHPNVTMTVASPLEGTKFPEKLDLFWISQGYHDLHDSFMGPVDMTLFNKAVYDALKPGGVYVVLDHSAVAGAPANVTDTLHRIEQATVRREVEAVGFKLDAESTILANTADPRTVAAFDKSVRGHTDQFILKFRKPKGA